jgi:hypothetical protein
VCFASRGIRFSPVSNERPLEDCSKLTKYIAQEASRRLSFDAPVKFDLAAKVGEFLRALQNQKRRT